MKILSNNYMRKFAIITLTILFVLEIFVFNYKSFLITPFNSSKYIEQNFNISNAIINNLTYVHTTDSYCAIDNNPTIIFDINTPVKTMRLNAAKSNWDGKPLIVNIDYTSESRTNFLKSPKTFSISNNLSDSQYVTCSYFGNVKQIKLTLNLEKGEYIHLNGFSTNEKIPMHFSFLRFIGLFLLSCLIFVFLKYPAFGHSYDTAKRSHKYAIIFTISSFLIFILFIYAMYIGSLDWFGNTSGNQMTQEIVDAFEHGQVNLMDEVPKELLQLNNPYDLSERTASGISYKWDHLLFEGKYYSYYGIAPVLTLFLPYHMITGYYFSSSLACLLYTLTASLFLALCFLSIVKNWFKKTPFRLVVLGTIITLFSSCAIINVLATNFYEIAQSSALCFLVIGFYFMLNSGIFMKKDIRLSYLFWSAFFVALSVLSRPTSALYAIAMVIWIVYGFFQYKKQKNFNKKNIYKYFAASMIPYVVFGLVQIIYNYLRFKNPLDFGIQYSLTINDFTRTEMHFGLVMISIVNFLFVVPTVNSSFPFISGNFDSLGINGYYFTATKPTIGLIWATLPTFSLLYTPKLARDFNRKEKVKLGLIWLLPGVIIPLLLIAVTWESGYAMRYNADFAWQICLAAFALIFYQYNRLTNATVKKWLFRILFVAAIWCVVCYIAVIFTTSPANSVSHSVRGADIYNAIERLVMFWK